MCPNWAEACYRVKGKRKHLRNLNSILNKLGKRKTPLVKNGFGNYWLGCLVTALGGDWNKVPCRGEIYDYCLEKDFLDINFISAWSERGELRDFIETHYDNDVKIYYYQQEPLMGIYETNSYDEFGFQYLIDGEGPPFPAYCSSLEEVSRVLKNYIGVDIRPDVISIEEAILNYTENTKNWLEFHEFSLVD